MRDTLKDIKLEIDVLLKNIDNPSITELVEEATETILCNYQEELEKARKDHLEDMSNLQETIRLRKIGYNYF